MKHTAFQNMNAGRCSAAVQYGCAVIVLLLAANVSLAATPLKVEVLEVEVETLEGTITQGTLTDWSTEQIEVAGEAGTVRFTLSELLAVRFPGAVNSAREPLSAAVELIDGSLLYGTELTVHDNRLTLAEQQGHRRSIPTKKVAAVVLAATTHQTRALQTRTHQTQQQWHDLRMSDPSGDLVVILRKDSLDYLEGVLGDVTASTVDFRLDDDVMQVPRSKVYGLVYFHSGEGILAPQVARVTDRDGQRIEAQSVELVDQSFRVVSRSGVEIVLPLATVTEIDFSIGKVVYLSDLECESLVWTPFYGLSNTSDEFRLANQPRRDAAVAGGPLRLDGVEYAKGLGIRSRTEMVYRLPDAFRRFTALVGIDDAVRPRGHVKISIYADDRQIFAQEIDGRDPPLSLSLDISGAKRLKILVDYGLDQDVADHVDFCEARVSK